MSAVIFHFPCYSKLLDYLNKQPSLRKSGIDKSIDEVVAKAFADKNKDIQVGIPMGVAIALDGYRDSAVVVGMITRLYVAALQQYAKDTSRLILNTDYALPPVLNGNQENSL